MSNPLANGIMGGQVATSPVAGRGNILQIAASAKRMMSMLGNIQDPAKAQQAIEEVSKQNPALSSVMQLVSGKDPQQVFYAECQKSGINPEDVLSLLR